MKKRIFWAVIAIGFLLLIIAPLASYCLDRKQDYRDNDSGLMAPHRAYHAAAVVTGPLIR